MKKRVVSVALLGVGMLVLLGCPIYPDDRDNRVCVGSDCYRCPDSYYSPSCTDWSCNANADCPNGFVCQSDHRCHLTSSQPPSNPPSSLCTKPSDCPAGSTCGADNKCHAGDCSTTGCPSSYVCKLANGKPECVPIGGGDGGTSTCKSDKDCPTPPGSKCLSGTCFAPPDQCADATQCPAGSQCVQGACTPSCSAQKPCPTGYACDESKGVCTGQTTTCSSTAQCTNDTVCVQEHCVEKCGAGGTCGAGLVCVDGGCMPDQRPAFACQADGTGTGCLAGSLCLRHTCYIGCDADAGNEGCKNADKFNVCKQVTTGSGSYSVCGSNDNLGSDCDPTQGKNCASPLVCIDGFCK